MQLSASLNSSHHLSTQPFTEMEGLNLWSFNLAQVRMGQLLFIMRPQHSYSNNAMQRLKDWIVRLLSYILYPKDIAENIYDNLCDILRPMDSHQNQISGYWEVAFYSKICVSTHKFNIETTSEWEYWFLEEIFSIPAPPLLTELYFCREALTISDCLSNLSCILSSHGVQSQRFLKEQPLSNLG